MDTGYVELAERGGLGIVPLERKQFEKWWLDNQHDIDFGSYVKERCWVAYHVGRYANLAEIERLREALRETLKIWDAFILCPICAGADGNHGMACDVPKWRVLAAETLAGKER